MDLNEIYNRDAHEAASKLIEAFGYERAVNIATELIRAVVIQQAFEKCMSAINAESQAEATNV